MLTNISEELTCWFGLMVETEVCFDIVQAVARQGNVDMSNIEKMILKEKMSSSLKLI